MAGQSTLDLGTLTLNLTQDAGTIGTRFLSGLLGLAHSALLAAKRPGCPRFAALGRLRGSGRGIHFRDYVKALESEHPIRLQSPFEDSDLVAGAVWNGAGILGEGVDAALAKLRWDKGADDLPMHVHDYSDRFIIVLEGRGFFHVTDQPFDTFDGSTVRSVPARERDIFMFSRGTVHTFSTGDEPMTLLSCQLPYLAFEDPDQYRIPACRWVARERPERNELVITCDPAWSYLMGGM